MFERGKLHALATLFGAQSTETAQNASRPALNAGQQILKQETLSSALWLIGVGCLFALFCNEIHVLNCFVVALIELL